jgi:MFS family permease
MSFFLIGGVTFLLALVTLLFTRDYRPPVDDKAHDKEHSPGIASTGKSPTRLILTSIKFWMLFVIFFGIYGVFLTLQGLWATPYVMSVLQIDLLHASQLNMVLPVGFMIGAPLFGWIADRIHTKKVYLFIGLLVTITLLWLALSLYAQTLNAAGLIVMFLFMGVTTGGWLPTLWALVRETTPSEIMGSISGWLNPSPFLGIAFYQMLTGAILDRVGRINGIYPPNAFQKTFWVCMLTAAVCLVLSLVFKKQLSQKITSLQHTTAMR